MDSKTKKKKADIKYFLRKNNKNTRRVCTFRYGQRRRPLIPQNIQTNGTIGVDVGVINLGRKTDLRRFERVIGRKGDGKEENTACIR